MNKADILSKRQEETLECLKENLSYYGKCAIIRPTGFGKTYLIAKFIGDILRNDKESNVLYVYPTDVIRMAIDGYTEEIDEESSGDNEFTNEESKDSLKELYDGSLIDIKDSNRLDKISYRMLGIQLTKEGVSDEFIDYILNKYDYVFFDEMHSMGAHNVKTGLYKLLPRLSNKGIKYAGATATNFRLDTFNVTKEFFNGHYVETYSIDNMINDGLIKKPYYIFASYSLGEEEVIKEYSNNGMILDKEEAVRIAKDLGKMYNCPEVLRRNILNVKKESKINIDYMKFICFFLTKEEIAEKASMIVKYFSEAFPDKSIRTLIVHSGAEYSDNTSLLGKMKKKKGVIDLIFSINMLNLGYHVEDITGIVMLRNTCSPIIYSQQIGRAISVKSDKPAIIFDFVQNLYMNPLWQYDDGIELEDLSTDAKLDILENSKDNNSRLGKDDYGDIKNALELLGNKPSRSNVNLIDDVKEISEYIRKMEVVPARLMAKAISIYNDPKNEISVDEVAKYLEVPIQKQLVRRLKDLGIRLRNWDVKQWEEVYDYK